MKAVRMVEAGKPLELQEVGMPEVGERDVLVRILAAGICHHPLELDTYRELIGKEAEIIGSNDHLLQELPILIEMARRKVLDTSKVVTRRVPLEAGAINQVLDELEHFEGGVRAVIVPE